MKKKLDTSLQKTTMSCTENSSNPSMEEVLKKLQNLEEQIKNETKKQEQLKQQMVQEKQKQQNELIDMKKKLEEINAGISVDGGSEALLHHLPIAPRGAQKTDAQFEMTEIRDEVTHHRREILHLKHTIEEIQAEFMLKEKQPKRKFSKTQWCERCIIM